MIRECCIVTDCCCTRVIFRTDPCRQLTGLSDSKIRRQHTFSPFNNNIIIIIITRAFSAAHNARATVEEQRGSAQGCCNIHPNAWAAVGGCEGGHPVYSSE